jgi:ribosomal protein L30/L7E
MAWLVLVQVRSDIRKRDRVRVRGCLRGLGLGRLWRVSILEMTPQVWGMIGRVEHLVIVEPRPSKPARSDICVIRRNAQRFAFKNRPVRKI